MKKGTANVFYAVFCNIGSKGVEKQNTLLLVIKMNLIVSGIDTKLT